MFASLKKKMIKAKETMKRFADNHRRDISFKVGDWVLVKLRPHRQTSVKGESYSKLAKCFYGPYQILERIGNVAYKIKFPDNSHIHPVFHCSLLKPCPYSLATAFKGVELPPTTVNDYPIISLLVILDSKWEHSEPEVQLMVLVHWEGLSLDDTSWENWNKLKADYHLEDKVLLDVGRNVIDQQAHQ